MIFYTINKLWRYSNKMARIKVQDKNVTVKETKIIDGKKYKLADVYPNYGFYEGHKSAKGYVKLLKEQGFKARVIAGVNWSAVYMR